MGCFRRAIRVSAEPRQARAEIEDDFHHFAVLVRHDRSEVIGAEGRAIRYPWSQCPMAAGALNALRGLPISADASAVYRHLDPLGQCTHMLEAAALAITQAARGSGARRYDVSVTDALEGRRQAELRLDQTPVETWTLQDELVVEPEPRRGLRPANLRSADLLSRPAPEAEILLIMRRAVWLAGSRGMDVDQFATAADLGRGRACYVLTPGVAEVARRRYGSVRDFTTGPGPLAEPTTP